MSFRPHHMRAAQARWCAPRRCRVCDCTDADCSACIALAGRPCHWVDRHTCSACVPRELERLINTRLSQAGILDTLSLRIQAITDARALIARLERAFMWERYDQIGDEINAVLRARSRGNLGIGVDRDRHARRYQRLLAESFALCLQLCPPTVLRRTRPAA